MRALCFLDPLKKGIFVLFFLAFSFGEAKVVGVVGGADNSFNSAAAWIITLNSFNLNDYQITPLQGLPSQGIIYSVALNSNGYGLIGGRYGTISQNQNPFAAYFTAASIPNTINFTNLPSSSTTPGIAIYSVALNASNYGIIGGAEGDSGSSSAYAALTSPNSSTVLPLLPPMQGGIISSVAINDNNQVLFSGGISAFPYVAFASYANPTPIPIINLANTVGPSSVAINGSGKGIVGGVENNGAYGALVDFTSNLATPLQNLPIAANSNVFAVAINSSGDGLIGGSSGTGGYAAIIPNGSTTAQTLSSGGFAGVQIFSVALNDMGNGIIGGSSSNAYAGWVSVGSNVVTSIDLSSVPSFASINYVAINSIGQALIAGVQESSIYYLALLQPFASSPFFSQIGSASSPSFLTSAAFLSFNSFPRLPTECLTKNNLKFANYINENAPQDVLYFIPTTCDNALKKNLESAAPTRNALSLFAADQNLFYLNHGLSSHLRDSRHFINRVSQTSSATSISSTQSEGKLIASASEDALMVLGKAPRVSDHAQVSKDMPNTLWIEGLGVLSSQKAQQQTVGFDPKSIGVILACDRRMTQNSLFGLGAAYTFTYVREHQNAGNSHINQEYLFLYAAWANEFLYVDGALWGALFQTDQTRYIHMTGFDFTSRSTPSGEQLSPHLEIGYENKQLLGSGNSVELILNPFLMGDWANSWQKRYKERGDSPFNAVQKSHYSSFLRAETGLRFYETFFFTSWNFVLSQKLSYVNQTSFGVGRLNAFLVGSPGSFTLETLSGSQNLGVAEFGLVFEPAKQKYPYGSISYQGELGESFQSHEINLELSWAF